MPRACTCCQHPERHTSDAAIVAGPAHRCLDAGALLAAGLSTTARGRWITAPYGGERRGRDA